MIINYFIKNFNSSQEYLFNDIKMIVRIKKKKISLFKNIKYFISVIIETDKEIITDTEKVFNFLIEKFNEKSHGFKKFSIHSNWYIFSNFMDENTFNKINIKGNVYYKNMINTFAVINKTNGEIFFNPKKIQNRVISERMKFLNNEYNKEYPLDNEKEIIFLREIKGLFDVLEMVLDGIRK
jgi:hypothetical protein